MLDRFKRNIHYLRISVTDKCNLRCTYCMPAEGIKLKKHEEILSFEEIEAIVRAAVEFGFDKFRLTGGEPLVRRDIVDLVKRLAKIDGVKELAMTTNGTLLEKYACELKVAGLLRLNISLDSLDPQKYKEITRKGSLEEALAGIRKAKEIGFENTKLNVVLIEGFNDQEDFLSFARENHMELRFIKKMDLKKGDYSKVKGGRGGQCLICDRIRLTADGKIRPCLFSDLEFDVRQQGIEKALKNAIGNKPEKGGKSLIREMVEIGG